MPAATGRLRILVTGRNGQVGWELPSALAPLGDVMAVGRSEMDLASAESVRACVRSLRPDLIVNAAAYTAVDKAEEGPELARSINAEAVALMAEEAKRLGAAIIHYSTDYVFDGAKTTPYVEEDPPHPLSVYGRTKLAGEQALAVSGVPYLVLRTSWVYATRGRNFLLTILKLAAERDELRIVDDQSGAPTAAHEIAVATAMIAQRWLYGTETGAATGASSERAAALSGVYHMTAAGETTWHGFATEALRLYTAQGKGKKFARLVAIPSSEYPTPAVRPHNSRLDCSKLARVFSVRLPEWNTSLAVQIKGL
jgi:dTDP-4-dehydrorhamnose reductase